MEQARLEPHLAASRNNVVETRAAGEPAVAVVAQRLEEGIEPRP